MNVKSLILLASMALIAAAFTVPAVATANVFLTEDGKAIATGQLVKGVSSNLELTTAGGDVLCKEAELLPELLQNGVNNLILKHNSTADFDKCTVTGTGTPVTIVQAVLLENLVVDTWGAATVKVTFIAELYDATHKKLVAKCHFEGNLKMQAVGGLQSDVVNAGPSALTGKSLEGPCPTTGTLHGSFKLQTDEKPVVVDFVKTG